MKVVDPLHDIRPDCGDGTREVELLGDVAEQAAVARDDNFGCSAPGLGAQQPKLERQLRRIALGLGDVRIDAVDECANDRWPVGMIVGKLGLHVAAELEQSRTDVARELARAEQLGDGAGRLAPPQLELEEPVRGRDVPLREKQIVLVLRVDVRDAVSVAENLDGPGETRGTEGVRRGTGEGEEKEEAHGTNMARAW